jgi:hypothetical protein
MKSNSNEAMTTINDIKSSDALITKVTMAGSDTKLDFSLPHFGTPPGQAFLPKHD